MPATHELMAQRPRLERLARALVRDDDSTDLVHDTIVTALSQPTTPRQLGPWLRQVLRNRVRMRVRRRGYQQRHEARVVHESTPLPPPHDEAAFRQEMLAAVHEAMADLDRPYADVLRWRFLEDRSPSAIAHEQGLSPATVRWRTHEAIRRVRGHLDRRFDGRKQWMAGLVMLAPEPTSGADVVSPSTDHHPKSPMNQTIVYSVLAATAVGVVLAANASHTDVPPAPTNDTDSKLHLDASSASASTSAGRQRFGQATTSDGVVLRAGSQKPGFALGDPNDEAQAAASRLDCADVLDERHFQDDPVVATVMWVPNDQGGHDLQIAAQSGCCIEGSMECGDESGGLVGLSPCSSGDAPTDRPELVDCLREQHGHKGDQLLAGESWGLIFVLGHHHEQMPQLPASLLLPEPSPGIEQIDPEHAPTRLGLVEIMGDDDQPGIPVLECGYHTCSFTRQSQATIERVHELRPTAQFFWLNAPFDEPVSIMAARASIAARNQGRFVDMHRALLANDRLVESEPDLAAIETILADLAESQGLDRQRFVADFHATATGQAVADERAFCNAYGLRGTPSFLIGGRMETGARPEEQMLGFVDEAVREAAE